MKILSKKDYLEVKMASLLADYDLKTISDLYQPIIGYKAMSVYLTLVNEATNQKVSPIITHEELFVRMQINASEFMEARRNLEAIGLLKSYLNQDGDPKVYYYEVYAPKTPKSFLENALFFGMLIKTLGEAKAKKLKNLYNLSLPVNKGNDVSTSFVEVFAPDYNDEAFRIALESKDQLLTHQTMKITSEFEYEKFFSSLKEISQITSTAFTRKDMKEIERLSTLYGLTEENAAQVVAGIYDAHQVKGKHLNYEKLDEAMRNETSYALLTHRRKKDKVLISGKTDLAQKVNLMEETAPAKYLSILQNGAKVAPSDLALLHDISLNYGLENSVINALVDYVLSMNDNVLSRPYVEKVAASLARQGVSSAYEAMEYLRSIAAKQRNPRNAKKTTAKLSIKESVKEEEEEEALSWDEIVGEANKKEDKEDEFDPYGED